MTAAFGWGLLAASSLVIGAVVAMVFRIGSRAIGLIMGFGAGVLISAVSFDLVEEAAGKSAGSGALLAGLFSGCLVFAGGDWLIGRFGGSERKDSTGDQEAGSSLAIVLGTVLDGIPESMVIGLTIYQGGAVGTAYLTAVFVSNLPEAISSTSGLLAAGWSKARTLRMWVAIAVVSGVASAGGYGLFQQSSPATVAFVLTFAAGAVLTMLANTMMPEAFEHGGRGGGGGATPGVAAAFGLPPPHRPVPPTIRAWSSGSGPSLSSCSTTCWSPRPTRAGSRWSPARRGSASRRWSASSPVGRASGSGSSGVRATGSSPRARSGPCTTSAG